MLIVIRWGWIFSNEHAGYNTLLGDSVSLIDKKNINRYNNRLDRVTYKSVNRSMTFA